jgi:hypothetical protein
MLKGFRRANEPATIASLSYVDLLMNHLAALGRQWLHIGACESHHRDEHFLSFSRIDALPHSGSIGRDLRSM